MLKSTTAYEPLDGGDAGLGKRPSMPSVLPKVDGVLRDLSVMAPSRMAQRLAQLDQPDHMGEGDAMWMSIRPMLILARLLMVLFVIAVGEIFDEVRINGLSIGVWALIAGIPLFLMTSMAIVYFDTRFASDDAKPNDG